MLQRMLRDRFGPRSEKLDLDQLRLMLEDEAQGQSIASAAAALCM